MTLGLFSRPQSTVAGSSIRKKDFSPLKLVLGVEVGKRFVDTALGRKAWFRKLSPRLKCAWRFLTEECDAVGIWSIDLDSMEFHIGERVTVEEMTAGFNSDEEIRVVRFQHDKIFVTGFLSFQYGTLSESCNAHISIIKKLKSLNLFEGYLKGSLTLMDKDKEEEKETDKETEEEKEEDTQKINFESAYNRYPRKVGKTKGIKKLKSEIKTLEDFQKLVTAIENYAISRRGLDPQFTKHFSTFVSEWRDWIDYKPEENNLRPTPNNPAYRRMAGNQHALDTALKALGERDEK